VEASLVLQCGAGIDPAGKSGVAALTADALDTGTSTMDALTISSALEQLGSTIRARAGYDGSSISLTSLPRHTGRSVEILARIITEAVFPEREVERLRGQRLTTILQQKDRPSTVASLLLQRTIYGGEHPYGNDIGGTEGSVSALGRKDVVGFWSGFYRPAGAVLMVVGPIGMDELLSVARPLDEIWKGEEPVGQIAEPSPKPPGSILVIDRPGSPQSEIRIGRMGLRRNTEAFFPAVVLNRILGGQFSSRLNANLRERHGYTYGAWSSFSFGKVPGPFVAGAAVHTANTGEALREIVREIGTMHEAGITAEELEFAREGILGSFALAFESPAQHLSILQNIVLYGLPEDYYVRYPEKIRRVTLEEVRRVALETLRPEEMSTVVVGDLAAVMPQLERAVSTAPAVLRLDEAGL
jgi:zinc protease